MCTFNWRNQCLGNIQRRRSHVPSVVPSVSYRYTSSFGSLDGEQPIYGWIDDTPESNIACHGDVYREIQQYLQESIEQYLTKLRKQLKLFDTSNQIHLSGQNFVYFKILKSWRSKQLKEEWEQLQGWICGLVSYKNSSIISFEVKLIEFSATSSLL